MTVDEKRCMRNWVNCTKDPEILDFLEKIAMRHSLYGLVDLIELKRDKLNGTNRQTD